MNPAYFATVLQNISLMIPTLCKLLIYSTPGPDRNAKIQLLSGCSAEDNADTQIPCRNKGLSIRIFILFGHRTHTSNDRHFKLFLSQGTQLKKLMLFPHIQTGYGIR